MRVVVTGAAGGVGRALIPKLCAYRDVTHVVGIDRVPISFKNGNFSCHVTDMQDVSFASLFANADAVIHLAFAVTQGGGTVQEMRSNNVEGTLNVFRAARSNRVRKVVNLSSASVYGNGELLTEDAPLRPSSLFPYACQKVEVEQLTNIQFPEIETVHLRSTFILGPNAPFLRRICTSRVYVIPRQPYPLIQVIHEDDVAAAILAALNPHVGSGVFNLAAPEAITAPALIKNGRSLMLGCQIGLVERLIGKPPTDGSARPVDAALELLRSTLTISCQRARSVLGWSPRYGAWEARASCDDAKTVG